jgi:hypothetical protein
MRLPPAPVLALAAILAAIPGQARPAGSSLAHLRGTLASVRGPALVIRTTAGGRTSVLLTAETKIDAATPVSLTTLGGGEYVAAVATGPDTHLVGRDVTIFPPAMRGTGEGHYPWDLGPHTTMTGATIASDRKLKRGRRLLLRYNGGMILRMFVPPEARAARISRGSRSELRPGAKVFVIAVAHGQRLDAIRIIVGMHGIMPPM